MKTLMILLTAFQDWSLSGDDWTLAATEATTAWDLQSDEKGGDSISEPSGELVNESASKTTASDQPPEVSAQDGYYVVMYTASWCGPCQQWKAAGNLERMRELGHPVTVVDIDKNPQYRGSVPRFEIIERGTGRRVWKVTGGVSPQTIVGNIPADKPAGPLASRPAIATHTSAGAPEPLVMQWNWEGNWSPSIAEMIDHLSEHGVDATGMTRQEMAATHDRLHNGYSTQAACPTCPQPQLRRRVGRFFGLFGR